MESRPGDGAGAATTTATGTSVAARQPATIERTAARSMLVAHLTPEPAGQTTPVPVEVSRQPFPQPEPALAGGAVPPRRGHLGHPHSQAVGLDRELDTELEAAGGLDRDLVEKASRVQTEVAGRVVDGKAADPVQRKARGPRH